MSVRGAWNSIAETVAENGVFVGFRAFTSSSCWYDGVCVPMYSHTSFCVHSISVRGCADKIAVIAICHPVYVHALILCSSVYMRFVILSHICITVHVSCIVAARDAVAVLVFPLFAGCSPYRIACASAISSCVLVSSVLTRLQYALSYSVYGTASVSIYSCVFTLTVT